MKNKQGTYDLPTQISKGTYPKEGLLTMHRAIDKHGPSMIQYARDVQSGKQQFKPSQYNKYLAFLVSAMYCWPQGRSRAIERITYTQFMKAFTNGEMPTSRHFKTSWGYGRQVVTVSGEILTTVLRLYITILRKHCQIYRESKQISPYGRGKGKRHAHFVIRST